MKNLVLDTHVLVWMFAETDQLSPTALEAIKNAESTGTLYVSSISVVELIYLTERNRIPQLILETLVENLKDPASAFRLVGLSLEIAQKVREIPEMPDRIISATANFLGLALVTADERIISSSVVSTVWK